MGRSRKIEQVVVLKSKFGLEERRVIFGIARLLPDRIVLKGLFFKRVIPLEQVQEVRWASDLVVLGLYDGEEIEMIIQSAALWKYELQTRCGLTDAALNVDTFNAKDSQVGENVDSQPKTNGVDGGLFDSKPVDFKPVDPNDTATKDLDAQAKILQRESTYRVKTLFAHDRPHKD